MAMTNLPNEVMERIRSYLQPTANFVLDMALEDDKFRHVSDLELETARVAQEEFEANDGSYYDDLYDGRWGDDDVYDRWGDDDVYDRWGDDDMYGRWDDDVHDGRYDDRHW